MQQPSQSLLGATLARPRAGRPQGCSLPSDALVLWGCRPPCSPACLFHGSLGGPDEVVIDMQGPSRMALPVRVPAAELRACVQSSCIVGGHVF